MPFDAAQTFRDQTDRLVELGYPALAGLDEADVPRSRRTTGEARRRPAPSTWTPHRARRRSSSSSPATWSGPRTPCRCYRLAGGSKPGRVDRNHRRGRPGRATTRCPSSGCRTRRRTCCSGIERGEEFCGVRPEDALPVITGRGRTPLTIDEGIAVVTHAPRAAREEQVLHALRLPPPRPEGAGDVDQRAGAEARLVLGRQPAHLAGCRLGRRASRRLSPTGLAGGQEVEHPLRSAAPRRPRRTTAASGR